MPADPHQVFIGTVASVCSLLKAIQEVKEIIMLQQNNELLQIKLHYSNADVVILVVVVVVVVVIANQLNWDLVSELIERK